MDSRHTTINCMAPRGWNGQLLTRDGPSLMSPYFAGTRVNADTRYPFRGGSPYGVGSPAISAEDANRLSVSELPSSFDWGSANIEMYQVSDAEWGLLTQAEGIVDMRDDLNAALGMIDTLDARDRANYNTQSTVTMPTNTASVDYSPDTVYASAPTAQVTQAMDIGTHNFGELGCSVAADGDGTYTFTITAETADPAGPHDISIDIKGEVPDTQDIDP